MLVIIINNPSVIPSMIKKKNQKNQKILFQLQSDKNPSFFAATIENYKYRIILNELSTFLNFIFRSLITFVLILNSVSSLL